jgi:putative Mn2+ efflux pump MntP
MDFLTLVFIAIGLSMDGLAVSITAGATNKRKPQAYLITALTAGAAFGGFQALMPILGWFAGQTSKEFVMGIDHWIAFLLLGFIGAKMLIGALKNERKRADLTNPPALLMLAIATSIDAFVVGITLAFLDFSILMAAAVIGTITFAICFAGVYFGSMLGNKDAGKKAEMLGGLLLIGIGTKILIEHLTG